MTPDYINASSLGIFAATAIFCTLLVRSVKKEIRLHKEIGDLEKRLSETSHDLAIAKEQLKILGQQKSESVSHVVHQLRSPITAIRGYASMLLEDAYGKLNDVMKAPIEKIFLSSGSLAKMVEDLLNASKKIGLPGEGKVKEKS